MTTELILLTEQLWLIHLKADIFLSIHTGESFLHKANGVIDKAFLLVLAGADMPAVLVEAGCLTNPSGNKKFADEKFLSGFSKGISQGIIDFF